MDIQDKQEFLQKSSDALSQIWDDFAKLEMLPFSSLDTKHTALIVVDMVNGFVKEGPLSSPRILSIVDKIRDLLLQSKAAGMPSVAFAETHTEQSPEFDSYPPHCLDNSTESDMIEELVMENAYLLIPKNSTNGFHEKKFQEILFTNPQLHTFVVTGCCTDICVLQFCLTLKTFFNMQNRASRIIVPLNAVETFELGEHDGGLMNVLPLKLMQNAGIELIKGIE